MLKAVVIGVGSADPSKKQAAWRRLHVRENIGEPGCVGAEISDGRSEMTYTAGT